jgi:hypothetical protein
MGTKMDENPVLSVLKKQGEQSDKYHRENFAAELQSLERMGTKMDENPVLSVLKKQGEQSDK